MALSAKIAFNTGLQVVSKIITTVISLAAVALVTRYLGSYDFGRYTIAVTFATFFSIAADFGLTLVTTQLLSRPGADTSKLISNLFTFRVISAAAILALGPIIVLLFPYDLVIKQSVLIASFTFFFILLNQVFTSLFQKELRADRIAIAEIGSRLIFFAVTVAAVLWQTGIFGILWAMALGNLASFLFHYYFSRAFVKIKWAYDKIIWRDIGRRSWPLILTIVLNLIYLRTDILLLSLFKTSVDVGLYGAAYKVIDVLVTVPFVLGGTVLPILTSRWERRQDKEYATAWQKVFSATAILAWPAMVGGFVLATPIMRLIAGDEFLPAAPILQILVIAVGGVFFSSLFSHTMISAGRQRRLIGVYAFTALSSLILYFALIPKFSYFGAAWVTVYSEFIMAVAGYILVLYHLKIRAQFGIFFKTLLAALIMGFIVTRLPISTETVFGLSLVVVIGALVYFVLLRIFGAVKAADLKEFSRFRI